MVKIIDGRAIADRVKKEITADIYQLNGVRPNLAVILVGHRSDSELYVSLKEKEAKRVGIDTHVYRLEDNVSEAQLLEVIGFLNKDSLIDGILIQLPLPVGFKTDKIISALNPLKDVDGFHPRHPDYIVSPVIASVLACLDEISFNGQGKKACIFYNSAVFGRGMEQALKTRGFEVSLNSGLKQADVLISSQGVPHQIKKEMIKEEAILIDVGITDVKGRVQGDVDYEDVKDKASFITPVPGGIGPMTIAFLFKNTLEIFKRRQDK